MNINTIIHESILDFKEKVSVRCLLSATLNGDLLRMVLNYSSRLLRFGEENPTALVVHVDWYWFY